jgi:hypothetical protein
VERSPWHSTFHSLRSALPWALCLAASAAATLANPYGYRVYQYVALTSSTAPGRHIDEWLPPGLDLLVGKLWVLSLVLALVLLALPSRRPSRRDLCLLCCFLPLACGSVRMVAWWLLVSAPILAAQLVALWPGLARVDDADQAPSPGAALGCAGLLLAVILSLPWLERCNPVMALPGRAHRVESDLQAVADHLAARNLQRRGGRVFTRFAWGEYLGWSLAPRYTVFMDGRIEIYPDEVWDQYAAVTRGRADWEEVLEGYGVDCLVLDEEGYHQGLLPQVRRSPCWRQVFRQGNAVLFVRDPPQPAPHWRTTATYDANVDSAPEEAILGPQHNPAHNRNRPADDAAMTGGDASAVQDETVPQQPPRLTCWGRASARSFRRSS